MLPDFRVKSRSEVKGGLIMELIPSGPDGRSNSIFLDEQFFGFVEPIIEKYYPGYLKFGHWGKSEISAKIWLLVIDDLEGLVRELTRASDGREFKGRFWFYEWNEDDFIGRFCDVRGDLIKGCNELISWINANVDKGAITIFGV